MNSNPQIIHPSLPDLLDPPANQIRQKRPAAVHDPMPTLHPMQFASLMLENVVVPLVPCKLEGLLLSIEVNHWCRRHVFIQKELPFVEYRLEEVFPHVEVGITSSS